ncbi:MAG: methyl-accepting chemotaxis protein [Ectothiorhodospiraceae bacterium]|nr:methyl-accepting chemotaxis protein [Ectothiorhodospiraceae bacterium]
MSIFNTLSIRYKILSIVAVAIVGFTVYFAVNFSVTSNNAQSLAQLRDSIFPTLEHSEKNLVRLQQTINLLDEAVSTEEEDVVEDAQNTVAAMQSAFEEIAELNPHHVEMIKTLQQALTDYFKTAKDITLGMLNSSIPADQIAAKAQVMQIKLKIFRDDLTQFRDQRHVAFTDTIETANNAANFGLNVGMLIGAALVLILAVTGHLVSAGIVGNLTKVSDNLREIARGEGDLTRRLKADNQDEVGQLVGHFNTFMGKLQGIIQELKNHSSQVGTASEELAGIAQQSLNSMERQRSDTDQVATASNEMAVTVADVAQNAELASEAASTANTAANNGSSVVDATISIINRLADDVGQGAEAVNRLREESQNVGTVLDVIRGIAEQTNLLALNAAIEAARAGEQGRGFAVVADEVRTLASRTQTSTQEIQTMIENLQSSAGQAVDIMVRGKNTSEQGVVKAANAGMALGEITSAVTVISQMNTQIASAAEEQSAVATDMDKNIANISQATEVNAENSNQLAGAGAALSETATHMQQLVAQFKV